MTSPSPALQDKHTTASSHDLYVSFELSDKRWKLTVCDGTRGPGRYSVAAGDQAAIVDCMRKAKARFRLGADVPVHSCYEAGRDGWWLHRWLLEQGIDNLVVDSSSIEVNRRAKHAKTDRIDGDKLLALLLRYHRGERRVWSVLHAPSPEQEDARRPHREIGRLTKERDAHGNRIRSLLILHNLRPRLIGGLDWASWWSAHRDRLAPHLAAEIEHEIARLALVKTQILALEAARRAELAQDDAEAKHPVVVRLSRLRAIGHRSAWILAKELFDWRGFKNRRQLAACLGMTPMPYHSGDAEVEQGISKAGNKRARALFIELAWLWLRLQPDSALSQWFNRRFAGGGKRMRRVGIVALARRLAVALWRYVEHGEMPAGAALKPRLASNA